MSYNKHILLADDEESDRFLFARGVKRIIADASLHFVGDGVEAIDYLKGYGKYADRTTYPIPSFLILDLKMPRASGLEVLVFIRQDPALSTLPAVVFSSSADEDDVRKAYMLGANSYFRKPDTLHGLNTVLHALHTYWSLCTISDHSQTGSVGKLGSRYSLRTEKSRKD